MQEDKTGHGEKIIVHVDEEIEDLIPGFLDNRWKDVEILKEALDKGDYKTILSLGHKMKGAGGGYGFDHITDLGLALENAAKAQNTEEIQRRIQEISYYLEHVEVIYE